MFGTSARSACDDGDQTPGGSSVESWSSDGAETPIDTFTDSGFSSDVDMPEARSSEDNRRVQRISQPLPCGRQTDSAAHGMASVTSPLACQSNGWTSATVANGSQSQDVPQRFKYSVATMMAQRDLSQAMPWHCVRDIPTAIHLLSLPDDADGCILATTPSDTASVASGAVTPIAEGADTEVSDCPEIVAPLARPARWKRGGRKSKKPSSPSDSTDQLLPASNLGTKRVQLEDRPFTRDTLPYGDTMLRG